MAVRSAKIKLHLPFTSTPKKFELLWTSKIEKCSKIVGRLLIFIEFVEITLSSTNSPGMKKVI